MIKIQNQNNYQLNNYIYNNKTMNKDNNKTMNKFNNKTINKYNNNNLNLKILNIK